ncbi:MAG: 3'-5' exonuclease [Bacteroides stercoris]
MEENLFPSGMAGDSPRALEEERRLFYVAITRAEDHCFPYLCQKPLPLREDGVWKSQPLFERYRCALP